ncbi:unnamed protein product, partial [Mesorhabditis belari]|uniref:Uncharacterized protein n=1 Tax=Mesorhabditis belari TaxID=2138241 RepID=A0AAF3EYD1_9BILA
MSQLLCNECKTTGDEKNFYVCTAHFPDSSFPHAEQLHEVSVCAHCCITNHWGCGAEKPQTIDKFLSTSAAKRLKENFNQCEELLRDIVDGFNELKEEALVIVKKPIHAENDFEKIAAPLEKFKVAMGQGHIMLTGIKGLVKSTLKDDHDAKLHPQSVANSSGFKMKKQEVAPIAVPKSPGSFQPRKILVAMQDAVRREPEIPFNSGHQAAQTFGGNGSNGGPSTTSYGFNGGIRKAQGFFVPDKYLKGI